MKTKKQIEDQCSYWAQEVIEMTAEEGGGLSQKAVLDVIVDPPNGEMIDDPAEKKIAKDWVSKNWSKISKDYKDARSNYKDKWENESMNEGRRSKFEITNGTKKQEMCHECGLPMESCVCEANRKHKKEVKKMATLKEVREFIRATVKEALTEASVSQVQPLVGSEAAFKYRKATGEVKTYFGRISKINGENVYVGVLGKGLRNFKIANIISISKAQFEAKQMKELDEMCKKFEAKIGMKKPVAKDPAANHLKKESDEMGSRPDADAFIADALRKHVRDDSIVNTLEDRFGMSSMAADSALERAKREGSWRKKKDEVSPPGWSGTVKAMKKHKDIKNPFALAYSMKKKGAHPHYKPEKD